ncbi:5-hydroxytryptamine receptor 2B-like [Stylophora pistillata]|uniref:5-hydroxytryptamine receptor 2B-like n=1 Tax=Stylophora pistillata TaxID=50429 RepID=UPI000C03A55B|nr:5-hydroxytryptamine receptor 2B-like [Stylophora pistillata]
MNDSHHRGNSSSGGDIEFIAITATLYVVVIIASFLGNITICVVIFSTRSLRRSVNSIFILSLAVSDLTTTCLVMPFDLEHLISGSKWHHGEVMCNIWTTTYLLAVPTSILSLLALTVYRYRLLQDPLDIYKSSPLMTRRRALMVVCCLWTYSMLFSLVPLFGWKTYPRSVIGGKCYFNGSWIYSVLSSLINFVMPVITASFLNCRMFCLAIRLSRKTLRAVEHSGKNRHGSSFSTTIQNCSPYKNENAETPLKSKPCNRRYNRQIVDDRQLYQSAQREDFLLKKLQKRNSRAAKTTILIVFSFVLCWFPHTLWSITYSFCKECFINVSYSLLSYMSTFFLMLGYLNSALNPILYSFRTPEFQKAVTRSLAKRFASSKEHSGRKSSHPRLSLTKSTSVDRETRL